MARKYLENELTQNHGKYKELTTMALSGLLVEFNKTEAEKLVNSKEWSTNKWAEVIKMLND